MTLVLVEATVLCFRLLAEIITISCLCLHLFHFPRLEDIPHVEEQVDFAAEYDKSVMKKAFDSNVTFSPTEQPESFTESNEEEEDDDGNEDNNNNNNNAGGLVSYVFPSIF